jgi:pseudouridine synthase
MPLRLQVFLSRSGACSRRKALVLIQSGHVRVNGGLVTEPSFPVDENSDVSLDGNKISSSPPVVILLNKPKGVITTVRDRFAEKTVLELLPGHLRSVHPVGRLDKDTTGLLLLTNDGSLTHRLIHPSFEVQKVYRAVINRDLDQADQKTLERGVMLEGKRTAPCQIRRVSQGVFEVTLHEGRKRQVRKMFAHLRYHVEELSRVRQGFLTLGELRPGEWRLLTQEEIKQLFEVRSRKSEVGSPKK